MPLKLKKRKKKALPAKPITLPEIQNHPVKENSTYLQQISHLEEILAQYQKKCDQLEIMVSKTDGQYASILNDKKQVVSFLKRELEIKNEKLVELNDELMSLAALNESNESGYRVDVEKLKKSYEERLDDSAIETEDLRRKLQNVSDFMKDRETTLMHAKNLEELVNELTAKHTNEIYELEKKHLFDKDKLKNEMKAQLNELASEFRHLLYDRMAESTKRLIRENVSLNSKLHNLTNEMQRVYEENEKLKAKELNRKLRIESLDFMQQDLAKKFVAAKQVAKVLIEKVGDEKCLKENLEILQKELDECKNENHFINQKAIELSERVNEVETGNAQKDQQIRLTEDYVKQLKVYKNKLEKLLQSSAFVVQSALSAEAPKGFFRSELMQQLLAILNSAKNMGLDLKVEETDQQYRFNSHFSGLTDTLKIKDTIYLNRKLSPKMTTKVKASRRDHKILRKEAQTQTQSTLSAHLYSIMLSDVNKKLRQEFQ